MLVADDLDFDVSGSGDEALDEERSVAERGLCLASASLEGVLDFGSLVDRAHASSAASGDGFDHHGVAVELTEEGSGAVEIDGMVGAGQDRDVSRSGERSGARLVTE